MKRLNPITLAACLVVATTLAGTAQETDRQPANLGSESNNFGLTPFYSVPTVALSPAAMQKLRDLEDAQLRDRRALEDRFAQEMRALLAQQAADRAALIAELSGQ